MRTVAGFCPMGCGQTLFLGAGGHVTCSLIGCPRPTAADELLGDTETEHIVMLGADEFTVRHPLRERLDDALLDCQLHSDIRYMSGPPRQLGRYRVTQNTSPHPNLGWHWQPLPAGETAK